MAKSYLKEAVLELHESQIHPDWKAELKAATGTTSVDDGDGDGDGDGLSVIAVVERVLAITGLGVTTANLMNLIVVAGSYLPFMNSRDSENAEM